MIAIKFGMNPMLHPLRFISEQLGGKRVTLHFEENACFMECYFGWCHITLQVTVISLQEERSVMTIQYDTIQYNAIQKFCGETLVSKRSHAN